jgi:NAD(P)H-flavin reductase
MNQEFEYAGEIVAINALSPSVKSIKIKVLEIESFAFVPGQFVIVSFPHIQQGFPYRSYSIAGIQDKQIIELCIVLKENGAATPVLFEMKVGQILHFSSPLGKFTLPDKLDDQKLCFICTGTGVAPFRAMLQYLIEREWPVQHLTLLFGCRTKQDLLYRDEFETIARQYPDKFSYKPILSREEWEGKTGYVHDLYWNIPAFQAPSNYLFYICGWTQMVKEAKNNLKSMGYSRKEIKFELYD